MTGRTQHPNSDPGGELSAEFRRAEEYLADILSQAYRDKDDAVELQPLPLGLEVSWVAYGSRVGTIVPDRALASAILELVNHRAGLTDSTRGELKWKTRGRHRIIPVEKFESRGTTAFRLVLKPVAPAG